MTSAFLHNGDIHKFQPKPPRGWRRLTGDGGFHSFAQRRDWMLVLNARSIPFSLAQAEGREHLFIPALYEQIAAQELAAYAAENKLLPVFGCKLPLHSGWRIAPIYLLPLVLYYGLECHWWPKPDFLPAPELWQQAGSLNNIQICIYSQWWRPATAIWLHTNLAHLVGNLFFGSIFICLLARLAGIGQAWFLTCLGAILGNAFSMLIHPLGYTSIGFSTAVFSSLGALSGILLGCNSEKLFMPLAAAIAILAMLGTEGANTDYAAHICGLTCGLLGGALYGAAMQRHWPLPPGWLAAAMAWLVPGLAWFLAFSKL